jgi:OOP family OmpA-OmpF porin
MKKRTWLMLLGLCGSSVLGQAQTLPTFIETEARRLEILGNVHSGSARVNVNQARLVAYSPDDLVLGGATSIFINGVYHASLIRGAYSDSCIQPGRVELGVRHVEPGQRPEERPPVSVSIQAGGGQTLYLRVREQSGRPVLQVVPAGQAERELSGKREQVHTISRVAQDCIAVPQVAAPAAVSAPVLAPAPTPVTPLPAPAPPKRHTLAADMLFPSGRSDRQSMSLQGLRAIDRLVAHLNNEYSRIDTIAILGHADPMGNPSLNERLAQERADTVKNYIEAQLQSSTRFLAVGRGSRDPIVRNCTRKSAVETAACHLPNRRVEIEVTGVRR